MNYAVTSDFSGDLALIDEFLSNFVLDKSPNTCSSYRNDIELLHKALVAKKKGFLDCESFDISEYFSEYLIKDQYGFTKIIEAVSVRRKLAAFRSFFKFLYERKLITSSPIDDVDVPKKTQNLPFYLTEEEIAALFEYTDSLNTKDGIRTNAILRIMYSCGLRVSECVSVKVADISDGMAIRKKAIILGKGNKERTIFIDKPAQGAIMKYLAVRHLFRPGDKSPYLFCAPNNTGHVTRQSVFLNLRKITYKISLSDRLSPHKLRHSFATHMYREGIDLRMLQMLLGHSDISTTEIYTHVKIDEIKNTVEKYHPVFKK